MEGLDDVFGEPNGPAYESRQTRTGPPLEVEFARFAATVDESLRGRKRVVGRVGFFNHETR